jgi:hypothetical protein
VLFTNALPEVAGAPRFSRVIQVYSRSWELDFVPDNPFHVGRRAGRAALGRGLAGSRDRRCCSRRW